MRIKSYLGSSFLGIGLVLFGLGWAPGASPLVAQDVVVSAAVPDNAPQGSVNLSVRVKGNGFKKGAIAKWLVTGSETDTGGVTVNSTTYVSSTELLANITVVADAQTEKKLDIKVTLTSGRTGKGIELFKVVYNPPDPAIAYLSGYTSIWVMNADGTNQMAILQAPKSSSITFGRPNWSPDGSQLVFESDIQGPGIYVIDKDGSGLRKVIALSLYQASGDPVWSPVPFADGEHKILFRDVVGSPALGDLFMVNLDGTGLTNLTQTPDHDEFYPTWDPNAARFAAQVYYPCTSSCTPHVSECALGVINGAATITSVTDLTAAGPLRDAYVFSPQWARTQDKIALTARLLSDLNNSELWIIDLADPANPDPVTQTSGASELNPSWSPDDSKIVYNRTAERRSKEKTGIFVINPDGTGATGDGYPTTGAFPDWRRCCPTCAVMCAP